MKRAAISTSSLVFLLLILLSIHSKVNAQSVQTNVYTSSNYSNSTTVNGSSHSTVTITCNGKTYTYESSGESIDANPCEGSHVKINNNGASATSNTGNQPVLRTSTPYPTMTKEQIDQKNAEMKKKIEDQKAKIKATITAMPKPTAPSTHQFSFDLGAWLRSLFASIFK